MQHDHQEWLQALSRGLDPLAWWASLTGYGGYLQRNQVRVAIELAPGPRQGLGPSLESLGVRLPAMHRNKLKESTAGCITALVSVEQLCAVALLPGVSRVVPGFVGGQARGARRGPQLALRLLRAPPAERAELIYRLRQAQAHGRSPRVVDQLELEPAPRRRAGSTGGDQSPLIGIIDFGCAFLHPRLLRQDASGRYSTRILKLWDQGRSTDKKEPPAPPWPWAFNQETDYGRVATRQSLDELADAALRAGRKVDSAMTAADWRVHEVCYAMAEMPELLQPGSHGTAVATLAAQGNDADILFVQLPQDAIDDLSGGWLTAYLVDALAWLQLQAGGRQLVVNLSVGTHAGPHDGSSVLERELERRAQKHLLVLAAGNAAGRRGHAQAVVAAQCDAELHWVVPAGDPTQSYCEVWYDLPAGCEPPHFSLEHDETTPIESSGASGSLTLLRDADGRLAGACVHLPPSADRRSGQFWIALAPTRPCRLIPGKGGEEATAPPGIWRLKIHNPSTRAIELHAWLERDEPGTTPWADRPDSVLHAPAGGRWQVVDDGTLTAQASAHGVLAVGGIVRGAAGQRLRESGQGPTRDGRPGVNRWAAADEWVRGLERGLPVAGNHSGPDETRSKDALRWRGTSLAAPQVVAEAVGLMTGLAEPAEPAAVIAALAKGGPSPQAARTADPASPPSGTLASAPPAGPGCC